MSAGSKCKNCGSSSIEVDPARGDAVCTDCGSVLEDNIIVAEIQYVEGSNGTSNAIGQFVSSDSKGGSTKFGASFHVGGGLESREFTLRKARNGISQLGTQLKLNQHCIDTACTFFKMALSSNLTRGRKNSHVYAACVYLSCRTEKTEHLLIDISDVLQLCCYELGRTYLKLAQALCISVPSVDPCLYILRFASKLEFGAKTQQVTNTALRLVQRMKRDSIHSGRRPSGLCGAALLIAARLHEFNRSIPDIVKVVKIHESTMRKRLTEFGDTPSSSLTLEEFMTVDLEEEQDPPSFKAARKKDKERLMKIMEEEGDPFNELQKTIEVQLEQIKSKSNKLPVIRNEKNLERSDAEKFIHESTMSVIQEIIEESEDGSKCSLPVELGPNIESIGLPNSLEDTCNALQPRDNEIELNLDFDDIDDEELDTYILTETESETKHTLWTEMNADYLQKQKDKQEQLQKEAEEGKPEKKPRKRPTKRTRIGPANSAGEAIERIIHEKKISSKINYDVLKNLNISPSDDTPTPNEEPTTGSDSAKRLKYSSDIIHEQTPKRAPRGRQLKDVGLPFIESDPSPPVEKNVKDDLKSKHNESEDGQVVEEEDAADFYDNQEEKPDESANQLGTLHMLIKQHHEGVDEDDYEYDDYGYEEDY